MGEDEFREPTVDEQTARRAIALALSLTNARRPRTTAEIREDLYGDLADDAFKKAFRRDRARLLAAGITLKEAGRRGREKTWAIDEDASWADEGTVDPDDALMLDFLLLPLASDAAFPYARDLRVALTKIDRAFDGTSTASVPASARARNPHLSRIEQCLIDRHMIRIGYTRSDGTTCERVVAPWGLFYLNGDTYMVASRQDVEEEPHTYNVSRISSLAELSRQSYEIPEDFRVKDFIRLPFQLGETRLVATFEDPHGASRERHEVADADMAVSWAIAEGLVVVSPPELRELWTKRLQIVASGEAR